MILRTGRVRTVSCRITIISMVLQIPNQLVFSALKTKFSALRFLRRTGFSASEIYVGIVMQKIPF